MGTNNITIEMHDTSATAPNYNSNPQSFTGANITKAVIIRQGTEGGNPTIDFQFEDQEGNKFVAMITGRILKTVVDAAFAHKIN